MKLAVSKDGANDQIIAHPVWAKSASQAKSDYTDLEIQIRKQVLKQQEIAMRRRQKLGG